jgi:hypothetical protein
VLVAITPTPLASGGEPTAAEALQADLTTFGAGARAAVIALPWDDLLADGEALSQRTALYGKHGLRVAVNLAVVDRVVDHRPEELAGKMWNAPETLAAMQSAVDAIFEASGDEVAFLTFGRDVDVYLAAHPGDRSGFVAFAKDACAYAKSHADAPDDLRVGVAFTTAAPKAETAYTSLLDAEDVVAFSYMPGLGTFEADAASGVAAAIAELADVGARKPVLLQAAGVPSDPLAGGSDEAQQKFFTTLFASVGARRSSFALVDVVELDDAPAGACTAWAEAQGEPADGPFAAYACSLGLVRKDGTPKPAWSAVLAGAAALSSP